MRVPSPCRMEGCPWARTAPLTCALREGDQPYAASKADDESADGNESVGVEVEHMGRRRARGGDGQLWRRDARTQRGEVVATDGVGGEEGKGGGSHGEIMGRSATLPPTYHSV